MKVKLKKILLIDKNFLKYKSFFDTFSSKKEEGTILLNGKMKIIYKLDKNIPKEISPLLVKEFFTYKEKRYIIPRFAKPYKRMTAKHAHKVSSIINNPIQIAPKSYAAILYKKGLLHHYSIEFQEFIENHHTFLEFYNSFNDILQKHKIISRAANLLAYLHSKNIGHLDLASKNIIMNSEVTYFIDLDTIMFCKNKINPLMLVCVLSDLNTFAKSIHKSIGGIHTVYFYLLYAKTRNWSRFKTRIIFLLLTKKFYI